MRFVAAHSGDAGDAGHSRLGVPATDLWGDAVAGDESF
jgi:hypothetical protein